MNIVYRLDGAPNHDLKRLSGLVELGLFRWSSGPVLL
jgi:hypothetical protein